MGAKGKDPAKRIRNQHMVPPPEGHWGGVLREEREKKGWSQTELAARASAERVSDDDREIGQNVISSWERGEVTLPRLKTMNRVEAALGLPIGFILERAAVYGFRAAQDAISALGDQQDDRITTVVAGLAQLKQTSSAERFDTTIGAINNLIAALGPGNSSS